MNSSRAKIWLKYFLLSFAATMFIMLLISVFLYHNGIPDALLKDFLPSIGTALLFSLIVFMRPQN